MPFSPSKLKD